MDITFDKVGYTYQPDTPFEYKAVEDISFHIPSGSFVAIIGHTGSGKSTLIQHLNGLLFPTKGKVTIGDFQLSKEKKPKNIKELRQNVGVVFQYPEHQLFEETIRKDIAFGPSNFGVSDDEIDEIINKVLPAVQLTDDFLDRSPFDLSGGQMRRVAIAGVLAMQPQVLVLDEPTAGLDPRGQHEIMEMFSALHKKEKLTTLLVTHSMEDALKYADYVLILDKGKLFMEGKPSEIFKDKAALNSVGLDEPEIIRFINKFNKRFNTEIEYKGQTIQELASEISNGFNGGNNDE